MYSQNDFILSNMATDTFLPRVFHVSATRVPRSYHVPITRDTSRECMWYRHGIRSITHHHSRTEKVVVDGVH